MALIGTRRGGVHARWLAACPEFPVVAVACAGDVAAARALVMEHHPRARITTDALSLVRQGGIDMVVVASPTDAHYGVVDEALRRGLLVVCETPLAPDVSAARKLADLAASTPGQGVVPFQWRESPALRWARASLAEAETGELLTVTIDLHDDSHVGPRTPWPWRQQLRTAGGGALADLGVHAFDLLPWLTGLDLWEVTSSWTHRTLDLRSAAAGPVGVDVDDVAQAELRPFGSPARARVMVSRITPGRRQLRLTALGTRGRLEVTVNAGDGSGVMTLDTGARSRQKLFDPHPMNPYRRLADDLTVRSSASSVASFDDGLAALHLVEVVLAGSRTESLLGPADQ
ncbi:Gfo/Idh/MocA family oxidoreductase [Nonomuraea helvata]|uniref:Gfo/Idh/MocA family protein n=1 Tax=Nonomuraea helvata TaxID=37484 RepID=UPI0031E4F3CF